MADAVSICNLALARIGEETGILSIDPPEGSEEAEACARFYPQALSVLLERHNWSFATRRIALAQFANEEPQGWKYAFSLPSDCIRVLWVSRLNENDPVLVRQLATKFFNHDFEIVARDTGLMLLTNCDSPYISYISSSVNPAMFSPGFTEALSWLLAAYLAGERVKGKEGASFARDCQQNYLLSLDKAMTLDARQYREKISYVPTWIEVR